MIEGIVYLQNNNIKVYKTLPKSSVMDYDYTMKQRLILSYHNHFEIYDKMTNQLIINLIFSDEIVLTFKDILYSLCDNFEIDNNDDSESNFDIVSMDIPIDSKSCAQIIFQKESGSISMEIDILDISQYRIISSILLDLDQSNVEYLYYLFDKD